MPAAPRHTIVVLVRDLWGWERSSFQPPPPWTVPAPPQMAGFFHRSIGGKPANSASHFTAASDCPCFPTQAEHRRPLSAGTADHADLKIIEGQVIRPAIGVEFGLMMAFVVAAEDQDMASTETTHCPKRSRLWWKAKVCAGPGHVVLSGACKLRTFDPIVLKLFAERRSAGVSDPVFAARFQSSFDPSLICHPRQGCRPGGIKCASHRQLPDSRICKACRSLTFGSEEFRGVMRVLIFPLPSAPAPQAGGWLRDASLVPSAWR